MEHVTKREAPMAESLHVRLTLRSRCPAGPVIAAHQRRRRPIRSSGRLYGPGGCGCALLMAALAVGGLAIAVALTVREVSRARGGASVRPGFAVAAGALYLASVPYLVFFIWLWFVD